MSVLINAGGASNWVLSIDAFKSESMFKPERKLASGTGSSSGSTAQQIPAIETGWKYEKLFCDSQDELGPSSENRAPS